MPLPELILVSPACRAVLSAKTGDLQMLEPGRPLRIGDTAIPVHQILGTIRGR